MPSIITDQMVMEDCFDKRFPIKAVTMLKPAGQPSPGIQQPPPRAMYYPASIESLGKGIGKTTGIGGQRAVAFVNNRVRRAEREQLQRNDVLAVEQGLIQEVSGILGEMVAEVERRSGEGDVEGVEEEKAGELEAQIEKPEGITSVALERGGGGGGEGFDMPPPALRRGRTRERAGRPSGAGDITPRVRRTKQQMEEAEMMGKEDIRRDEL